MVQFLFRTLLKVPEVRHIPTFAMAAEKRREAHEESVLPPDFNSHSPAFDTSATPALQAGCYGDFRVIGTRTRLNRRNALYATWVSFDEADAALAFERDHLTLGLTALGKRLNAALQDAQAAGEDIPSLVVEDCLSTIHALTRLGQPLIPYRHDTHWLDLRLC